MSHLAHASGAPAAEQALAALTTGEPLRRLERTLQVLLTPLDYPSWTDWRDAAHRALCELTGADGLGMHLPLADDRSAWHMPHVSPEAGQAFLRDMREHDIVDRAFARSAEPVAHEIDLVGREALEGSVLWNEFARPNRLFNLTLARADFGGPAPARLWFTDADRPATAPDAERAALVRTILPALRAGLATWQRVGAQRAALGRLLDAVADPALLFDAGGALVHANPAAARLIDDAGGERGGDRSTDRAADRAGAAVRSTAQSLAWSVAAMARRPRAGARDGARDAARDAVRDVPTPAGVWQLRATLAPEGMLGSAPGVLVTARLAVAEPLDDDALRDRYALTDREIEVARLVAAGLSNKELAARLGVSFFTARNHVERLLGKLGVTNRSRVGALLRAEAA